MNYNLMKYIFALLAVTIGLGYETYGQIGRQGIPVPSFRNSTVDRSNNSGRKIQVVKEGFINKRLNLTPEEYERFMPLYRQYQQEMTAVRRLKRLNNSNSQADGTEQINKELYYDSQLVNIRKRYKDEFLKILPPEKVSELYKSEREFNDEMIKQLSERNQR